MAIFTEPAIRIDKLRKEFSRGSRRVTAVNDVSIAIGRGEIVALLGPNGAGKTTTIDMLLGLTEPDSGEIRVLGMTPREAIVAGHLSALLQTGGLLADLTVRETVTVIAGFHRASSRVDDTMQRAGLTEIAARRVGKCSGGEQQRVKFALALLPDPDILVLDEPTAGMDVNARKKFWEVMREEAGAGRTIIFATHYLEEAEQFAERTIVINHGQVVADAETTRLRASLGGRIVSAALPDGAADSILAELATVLELGEHTNASLDFDSSRVRVQTTDSDAMATRLLGLGAYDLEIATPTLETAFSSLTEN